MEHISLYHLAKTAGMNEKQLAEAVVRYVEKEVGFHPAQALKHVLAAKPVAATPPEKPQVVKTLTVQPKKSRRTVSVVFTAPKPEGDTPTT
jgi:hypothetical protein